MGPTDEDRVEIFKVRFFLQFKKSANAARKKSSSVLHVGERASKVCFRSPLQKSLFLFEFLKGIVLPNHGDRRAVFEQFTRNRVGEQRQERKEKLIAARDICKKV